MFAAHANRFVIFQLYRMHRSNGKPRVSYYMKEAFYAPLASGSSSTCSQCELLIERRPLSQIKQSSYVAVAVISVHKYLEIRNVRLQLSSC